MGRTRLRSFWQLEAAAMLSQIGYMRVQGGPLRSAGLFLPEDDARR